MATLEQLNTSMEYIWIRMRIHCSRQIQVGLYILIMVQDNLRQYVELTAIQWWRKEDYLTSACFTRWSIQSYILITFSQFVILQINNNIDVSVSFCGKVFWLKLYSSLQIKCKRNTKTNVPKSKGLFKTDMFII